MVQAHRVSLGLTHSGSGFNQGGKAVVFSCNAESNTHPEVCRRSTVAPREKEGERVRDRKIEGEILILCQVDCLEDIHSTLFITKGINYVRAITPLCYVK